MIVRFTFDRDTIPADAVNIRQSGSYGDNVWLYDTHVGLCLYESEENGRDDSDFYMTVWNPEKGEPKRIMFATTRGWSYPSMQSCPDATPEVRAAYEEYREQQEKLRQAAAAERERRIPRKGKRVKTVKRVRGKNSRPEGTKGVVFWEGPAEGFWGRIPDTVSTRREIASF